MTGWNLLPNELKKYIIELTGGFKPIHSKLFKNSLQSISRRESIIVCYICGLRNALSNEGLKRNPSTRLYIKYNTLAIEIFARCSDHSVDHGNHGIQLVPRHIETDLHIMEYVKSLFIVFRFVYIFNTDEDRRYSWRIIGTRSTDSK